jgi:hypothetical protein
MAEAATGTATGTATVGGVENRAPGARVTGRAPGSRTPAPNPVSDSPSAPTASCTASSQGHTKNPNIPRGRGKGRDARLLTGCMHGSPWVLGCPAHAHRRTTQREDSKTCVYVHVSSHTCDLRNSWIGWYREACLWIGCARRGGGLGAGHMGGHAGCTRVLQACDAGMACARLAAWTHMHTQAQPIDTSHPLSPHHDAAAPSTDGWVQS